MTDALRQLDPQALWRVVTHPGENLTAAAVLLAIAVLVLMIVLTVVGLLLLGRDEGEAATDGGASGAGGPGRQGDRSTGDAGGGGAGTGDGRTAPRGAPRRLPPRIRAYLVLAMLAAAALLALYGGSADATCLRCHGEGRSAAMSPRAEGAHAGIACRSCHARPGAGGRISLVGSVVRDGIASVGRGEGGGRRTPPSVACLRCHDDLDEPRTVARVRVSHAEFLADGGFRCVDCHAVAGHEPRGRRGERPRMTLCLRCHDDDRASAGCPTCHVGDITGTREVSLREYPRLQLPPPSDCRGCHDVESCNECHGLEMPHPEGFELGETHGRLAAFERRELCDRCHAAEDCAARCHLSSMDPSKAHPAGWRSQHGVSGSLEAQEICRRCHNRADFSCNMCHSGYPQP